MWAVPAKTHLNWFYQAYKFYRSALLGSLYTQVEPILEPKYRQTHPFIETQIEKSRSQESEKAHNLIVFLITRKLSGVT